MNATTQTAAATLAEVDAIAAEMREIDRKARHGEAIKRDFARNNRINARRHQLIAPYGSYNALHAAVHGEPEPVVYAPAPTAYAALVAFCEDAENPANSTQWLAEYDRLNAAYIAAHAIDADAPGTYRGYVYADHMERYADE